MSEESNIMVYRAALAAAARFAERNGPCARAVYDGAGGWSLSVVYPGGSQTPVGRVATPEFLPTLASAALIRAGFEPLGFASYGDDRTRGWRRSDPGGRDGQGEMWVVPVSGEPGPQAGPGMGVEELGRMVHYVAHGTPPRPDGTQAHPSACRAAFITAPGGDGKDADLLVMTPQGMFHNRVEYAEPVPVEPGQESPDPVRSCGGGLFSFAPGTWHRPLAPQG